MLGGREGREVGECGWAEGEVWGALMVTVCLVSSRRVTQPEVLLQAARRCIVYATSFSWWSQEQNEWTPWILVCNSRGPIRREEQTERPCASRRACVSRSVRSLRVLEGVGAVGDAQQTETRREGRHK